VLAVVAAVAVAVSLASPGGSSAPATGEAAGDGGGPAAQSAAGEPVPDRSFQRFDEGTASFADYRGTPLVVNFWASWCPPCVAEMRDAFQPLHQRLGDQVAFLGINLQDTRAAAKRTLNQTGVTYDLAVDPEGELFSALGGFGMPTTVFVSADGRVLDTHTGAITEERLQTRIDELFQGV
jgi:thiol-disulfide isomerase/thioredoxin